MKKALLLFLLWSFCFGLQSAGAQTASAPPVKAPSLGSELPVLLQKWGLSQAGVVFVDLAQGKTASYQADKPFPLGRLVYLPLLSELQRQQEMGLLSETQILQWLPLQQQSAKKVTLEMIATVLRSTEDLTLSQRLTEILGYDQINQEMLRLGLQQTRFFAPTERDGNALPPQSTAQDLALLLTNLNLAEGVSSAPLGWDDSLAEMKLKSQWVSQALDQTHLVLRFQFQGREYLLSFLSPYTPSAQTTAALQGFIRELLQKLVQIWPFQPRSDELVPGIYLSDQGFGKKVVLTFDDGPNHHTERILNILKKHGVKATFFVLGERIQGYGGQVRSQEMALIRRMVQEGHNVGNHSFSHPNLATQSPQSIRQQLERTNRAIQQALGYDYPVRYFRPPYGVRGSGGGMGSLRQVGKVDYVLKELNQALILWQADSLDWQAAARRMAAAQIASNVYNQLALRQGGVVLFHDIHGITGEMLDGIIHNLKTKGYQLVTLDEIMTHKYGEN